MTETTKKTTAVNYTDEMQNQIVDRMASVKSYADQVEAILELSAMLNRNVRSVTAKLSNMARSSNAPFEFFKKESLTKSGTQVQRKSDKVAELEKLTGRSLESLEKANKSDLQILINALTGNI